MELQMKMQKGNYGPERFKQETLLDIVSCDYRQLEMISGRINQASRRLASRGPMGEGAS